MKGISRRGFTLCSLLLVSSFCGLETALQTYYVDELCFKSSRVVFDSTTTMSPRPSAESGVLLFVASSSLPVECEIVLRPSYTISPVLSIVSYNLHSEDELVITDSDRFSVKLVGSKHFRDERKAFVSDGDLTIRFTSNHTNDPFDKTKFHFVYTMARRGPCLMNEFECRNGKCIDENLVCDSHNHCGDSSDQKKCVPMIEKKPDLSLVTSSRSTNPWIITVIVCSVIFGVVLIALISVFIHQLVKKKKASPDQVNTTHSTDDEQPASFFNQVKRSFRSTNNPNVEAARDQLQRSENSQVSSEYPQVYPSTVISVAGAAGHDPQQPGPSFMSQIKKSFRSAKNSKVDYANELQRSGNYQTPSMYPEIPSAPELSGVDNPDFSAE